MFSSYLKKQAFLRMQIKLLRVFCLITVHYCFMQHHNFFEVGNKNSLHLKKTSPSNIRDDACRTMLASRRLYKSSLPLQKFWLEANLWLVLMELTDNFCMVRIQLSSLVWTVETRRSKMKSTKCDIPGAGVLPHNFLVKVASTEVSSIRWLAEWVNFPVVLNLFQQGAVVSS